QAEALVQVCLPQIAEVVIDAARFGPARHRPELAREQEQADKAAEDFQRFHRFERMPMATPPLAQALANATSGSAPCPRALPSSADTSPVSSPPGARWSRRSRRPRSRGWAWAADSV